MKRIYLDYAATTPILPDVALEIERVHREEFGNPSALYAEGRVAKTTLQKSRDALATALGAKPEEFFFTSGGTESNFLAIRGIAYAVRGKGRHLLTTQIEHSSTLGTFESLQHEGFEITRLPVNAEGILEPEVFRNAIRPDTVFASVMLANNEIGTLQPITKLSSIAKEFEILMHVDAVCALPALEIDLSRIPIDALSVSSHKIYGPKGVGALFLRRGTPFESPFRGGNQERKVRPGTENVPAIAGFRKALELLEKSREVDMKRILKLRNRFRDALLKNVSDSVLNGHPLERLPNNLNFTFRHADGESLLIHLDLEGISCSMGSACASGAVEPSHVLLAVGRSQAEAKNSIRFTLGKFTQDEDIDRVIEVLPPLVSNLREKSTRPISNLWPENIVIPSGPLLEKANPLRRKEGR